MINRNKQLIAASVVAAVLSSNTVFAAGFEKSILWSGKYAGQGNAAVSSATGAEALYFNPAGLAGSKGTELSLNVSPTFSKFSGPVTTDNTPVDGVQTLSPVFGAMASYAINEKLGFGVGAYVAAGARAKYENADVPVATMNINPETNLNAIEYSAGLGYEVMPGFKVGAAVRYTQVTASLTSASIVATTNLVETTFTDMKASKFGGFRVGASYDAGNWGLGANFRSEVAFEATGSGSARRESLATPGTITSGALVSPTVASSLPAQLSVGGHYAFSDAFKLAAEYVLTNYNKVTALNIGGNLPSNILGGAALSDLTLNFRNQTNVRVGASYAMSSDLTLRGGYVYTSQVTATDLARPTLTPPGTAHSITAGAGYALSANMDLNIAGEYATAKGTGTANATAQTKAGDYSANGYMVHTGLTYRM